MVVPANAGTQPRCPIDGATAVDILLRPTPGYGQPLRRFDAWRLIIHTI